MRLKQILFLLCLAIFSVADVTAQRNRTTYMTWITAVQYAGFTVTPFVGATFNRFLEDIDVQFGYVSMICFSVSLSLLLNIWNSSNISLISITFSTSKLVISGNCLAKLNLSPTTGKWAGKTLVKGEEQDRKRSLHKN